MANPMKQATLYHLHLRFPTGIYKKQKLNHKILTDLWLKIFNLSFSMAGVQYPNGMVRART